MIVHFAIYTSIEISGSGCCPIIVPFFLEIPDFWWICPSAWFIKYISPLCKYTHVHTGVPVMAKDYSQIIGTLKEAAIGRCRQRIDASAKRVQDLVKNSPDEKEGVLPCGGRENYSVTSVFKRQHGL